MKKPNDKQKPSEEFERFRDFTKRLMAVPKKEIDQQKEKYDKHKAAKPKPR